jgi:hypothetical protein
MSLCPYIIHSNNILEFSDDFNEPLDLYMNILETVKIIKFGTKFNQSINDLPDNIEYLVWYNPYYTGTINKLPKNFKKVYYKTNTTDEWMNIQNMFIDVMAENEAIKEPFDITTFNFAGDNTTSTNKVNDVGNVENAFGYNKSNGMCYTFY